MSYFAGIDLHERYLTLCVLDPDGNAVVQHRRLTTDGLFAVLGELDRPLTVAVEATLHWAWLHDRLLGPIGHVPPVEFEEEYYKKLEGPIAEAELKEISLR